MKQSIYYQEEIKEIRNIEYFLLIAEDYERKKVYAEYVGGFGLFGDKKVFEKIAEKEKEGYVTLELCNSSRKKYEIIKRGSSPFSYPTGQYKTVRKSKYFFEDWKPSKKEEDVFVLFFGKNLTIFSEKGYIHTFPIRGNYVLSRKGSHLFFADEEKGRHIIKEEHSKRRNRFASDEQIIDQRKSWGAIYAYTYGDYIYSIWNV